MASYKKHKYLKGGPYVKEKGADSLADGSPYRTLQRSVECRMKTFWAISDTPAFCIRLFDNLPFAKEPLAPPHDFAHHVSYTRGEANRRSSGRVFGQQPVQR
jgi:hypothetical protein